MGSTLDILGPARPQLLYAPLAAIPGLARRPVQRVIITYQLTQFINLNYSEINQFCVTVVLFDDGGFSAQSALFSP
jgi:hypothetical protein